MWRRSWASAQGARTAPPLAGSDYRDDTEAPKGPRREVPVSRRRSGSGRKFLLLASAAAVALLAGAAIPVAAAARTGLPAKYYVSLGDSLAQGVQPDPASGQSVETDRGYVDDLFAHYSAQFPGHLHLVKLGCAGETTTSMLTGAGSPCTYPQGSQLAAAVAFITAHRSEVTLITID